MRDILNAFHVWRRRPLLAVAVILTFALGAGANLAVFRLIWTVMLQPLPYAEPDRIMQIWQDDGQDARKLSENIVIERWREASRSFASVAGFRRWQVTVAPSGFEPERVTVGLVSAEFFDMLGVKMWNGRAFTRDETRAVILSHSYWARRQIRDAEIQADGELCQVVGVLPPDFRGLILGGTDEAEIYLPVSRATVGSYKLLTNSVAGRLRPGVAAGQAQADLTAIAATVPKAKPARIWLSPIQEEIGHGLRPALIALFSATVCVLLVACFNIANLLMAHAAARQRELAIRVAMGASRARLIRQLLVESLMLALAGGAAAFAAGSALTKVMVALYPDGIPRAAESGNNAVAIGTAFVVALGCGLLVGLLPAWRVTGGRMEDWLRVGQGWMARARRRWADALVAAQVMLTVAVLIGAGLLFKSFMVLRGSDPGFARENVVTAAVSLPGTGYGTKPQQARFAEQLTQRVRAIPGVMAAGLTNSLPMRYTVLTSVTFQLPGEEEKGSMARAVSGSYFQAMGLRMVAGRPLGPEDDMRKNVIVVNEAFVRRFLAGRAVLGTQLGDPAATIVGVVKDVRHRSLTRAADPEIYLPISDKLPSATYGIAVRSTIPQAEMAAALRRELRAIDSQLALEKVMTLDEVIDANLARSRFQTVLLVLFAAVALALAAVGGYSVVAQSLRARTQEFGVRRAVGAQTGDILALVAREGMRAPLLGLVLGSGLAWVGARYLSTMLYGVKPEDAGVWIASLGVLAVVCLGACAWAGRLAVRVQPSQALRNE